MARVARFRVVGRFDGAGAPQVATVTIDREAGLFGVRVLRRRREYVLPLADVAAWSVQRLIKAEVAARKKERREAKRARR